MISNFSLSAYYELELNCVIDNERNPDLFITCAYLELAHCFAKNIIAIITLPVYGVEVLENEGGNIT